MHIHMHIHIQTDRQTDRHKRNLLVRAFAADHPVCEDAEMSSSAVRQLVADDAWPCAPAAREAEPAVPASREVARSKLKSLEVTGRCSRLPVHNDAQPCARSTAGLWLANGCRRQLAATPMARLPLGMAAASPPTSHTPHVPHGNKTTPRCGPPLLE